MHSKNGEGSEQEFRRKLQGIINTAASTSEEQIPAIDPATGLPVPAATPSTPIAGEKLTELAREGKDANGSNIYLGMELAKVDSRFGTWSLETGGLPSGRKKEEESLGRTEDIVDGSTAAGRSMRLEKKGVALLSPSVPLGGSFTNAIVGVTAQDGDQIYTWNAGVSGLSGQATWARNFTVDGVTPNLREEYKRVDAMAAAEAPVNSNIPGFQGIPALGDLPVLGKSFKGAETKAGQTTSEVESRPGDLALAKGATATRERELVTRQSITDIDKDWLKPSRGDTGTSNRGRIENAGEPQITLNGITQGLSNSFAYRLKGAAKEEPYDRNAKYRNLEQIGAEGNKETKLALNYSNVKQEEAKIREGQTNGERLREKYQIADAMAAADAPTMLMSAESLRKLEGMRIELESQVMREETMLDSLKKMPRDKLVASLPTAAPDTTLNSLLEQKNLAEQALILKQRELGESSAEVAKLRSQVTDLGSKIDQQADGILSGLDTRVAAVKGQLNKLRNEVENAKTNDVAVAQTTEWEAKRKLDDLQRFSQVLASKIAAENIEASLPKSTMVEIMGDAVPAKSANAGFWDRLRGKGKYESQARIKMERDQSDIAFSTAPRIGMQYDPYFIQNEFETMKSDRVLGRVVTDLNLQKEWAKGGQTLSSNQAIALLKQKLDLKPVRDTSLVDIEAKSDKPEEAAKLANAVARSYQDYRLEVRRQLSLGGIKALEERLSEQEAKVHAAQKEVDQLRAKTGFDAAPTASLPPTKQQVDMAPPKPAVPPPVPQPEVQTRENAFSTFSLNVSDVAFKLAGASLEKGQMPEAASIRSEEFINAFDYRDPEAPASVPIAFAWERARYPYAQNRDLLRFSIKTAAQGRQAGRPLNLVLLMDNSGSMERADRIAIIRESLKVLASQLQPQDKLSVITFARTAQLRVDGVVGNQAAQVAEDIGGLTPEGGTNIEEAMNLAYQTALRHYLTNGINRVVLLTDGAANLGNVEPESLKQKVEANRKQGVALDCFGIGWEGFNDDLLETLSRNGDGRYSFINTPDEAATEFAGQLAGALNVAASDVKVQVEFNPARVTAYRQIGYAKHQLTKEQFRDNTVDAAEIAAQEAGNALYVVEVNPAGEGPLGTVRVRFKVPGTSDYREHEWTVPFNGNAVALEQASPAMRLAATASAFSEWLATSPFATEVTPDTLLRYLGGVPEVYGADARPKKLEWMIRQAKSVAGGETRNSNVETRNNGETRNSKSEARSKSEEKGQFP
jgi:Mg-chelatase subunit ChlD/uncharacterized protein involved in exopolysaccharide biosynthesis